MDDLITVILPVYNVSQYLHRCIKSVISQTYKNIEIILVDDGSTDNSGSICDEYKDIDHRIKVIHKVNGGLSDARNAGIEIATGEYLTFIDSDDYIDEDYVKYLYGLVKEGQTLMSICSHTVVYDNGTVLKKETGERQKLESKTVLDRILYDEDIDLSAWAKLYHKSLFKDIRFPVGRLFEDAATTYKFIDKSGYVMIGSQSKYYYMIRSNSISTVGFSRKKIDLITSTKEMCDYCENKYPELKSGALRRLTYSYLSTLSQLANSNVKDIEIQKELMSFIRKNGLKVVCDKRSKNRDRLGIISTFLGYHVYKYMWHFYRKVTGRI